MDPSRHASPREHASLRERKKARTRASLREHALRLFREQGYAATTVEQIAAAAEVSPSTFFRYFPTKEDVVLQDDMDVRMMEALECQPPELSPVAALRAGMKDVFASFGPQEMEFFRASTELTLTVPEVRARAMDEFARTIDQFAQAIAKRSGRSRKDMNVRVLAGAILGVIMSVTMPWSDFAAGEGSAEKIFDRIDEALAMLESGLPL
ncbi:MAG: TetR family transcriptional regulator [Nocardiopsaceae bacterium]|nr:TetR family transcriptional regulator [Nocardiopsaceae bacterium]